MMKKILKALFTAVVTMLAAAALTITACAEDYVFEITEPSQTNGEWDLAFIYETANAGNFPDNFDAAWMTPESEVIVEYICEGKCSKAPLELIWQTWKGPVEPDPDVKKNWNKVSPYEYSETSAKFSFADIAKAYGTDNFSTVYAINIGDRGVKLTVTGITVTNCNIPGTAVTSETETQYEAETEAETETEAEPETEAETEAQTEKPTETKPAKETSAPAVTTSAEAETSISESEPAKDGGGAAAVIIVIIIFVIMAAVMASAYFSKKKKRKNRYY
ncbi:MAG: hypothetical protein MSJ26_03435 [Oscillospiraceae bacterium]|nr:hypothetical protein [Oscillospiraceae bacterium]